MGRHPLPGRTVLAVATVAAGAALFTGAAPALAADLPVLYVNNDVAANCSDGGSGTQAQPYCTLGTAVAAVSAGQTIAIAGAYNEHITIDKSGEPGRPITLQRYTAPGAAVSRLAGGPDVGFTIDGQHDIVISGVWVINAVTGPAFDIRNSSRITVENLLAQLGTTAALPGVKLTGVTDSALTTLRASGRAMTTGIALDAATSGVVVTGPVITNGARAVEVLGARNTILNGTFGNNTIAGISIGAGATGTVVANNSMDFGWGVGIDNTGATGTAITNNTITNHCAGGIRVAGASSGVSVQNNVTAQNVPWSNKEQCDQAIQGAVEIGAGSGTVVDYNTTFHGGNGMPNAYAWNGTPLSLTAFRAASGQSAHDIETALSDVNEDSANSAAPGWQSTDSSGNKREDNPNKPNTGAGPVPYADRGATESVQGPLAALQLRPDHAANSIVADASGSTPGFSPIVTYSFDWGDSTTTTQSTAVVTHHYAQPGTYTVVLTVTDANGHKWLANRSASLWPTVRTIALLAHENNRYVTSGAEGYNWLNSSVYSWSIGAPELFDVVEPGNGHVALRSRLNGTYFAVNWGTDPLLAAGDPVTDDMALFDLTTDADGNISLWSVGKKAYVSSNSGTNQVLTADRTAIGPWERFGVVDQANATVTLKAHANAKYVTADNGGNSPLIANRTTPGQWETFDLVDAGNGYVALYSHANGKYVTADNGGNSPLIANRTAVGAWEKFKITKNADGSTSLQANANGKYVTADNAGNSALIANRTAIGSWEEFN
ncbi:PKD domain-containing protein [Dactylosporangium sp. CA-233914]|uniref:PKD domain-containing protein n=1 Tax=Dactylosporangium sp. CA-233914 TaxID=3239934 RepID=UPI003D8BB094